MSEQIYKRTYSESPVPDDFMQITKANPLVLTSLEQLQQALLFVFEQCGIKALVPEPHEIMATEMPTRVAKKFLQERGHRVISDPAFNQLINEYKVPKRKRGKENWFLVTDLKKIPPRVYKPGE